MTSDIMFYWPIKFIASTEISVVNGGSMSCNVTRFFYCLRVGVLLLALKCQIFSHLATFFMKELVSLF